MQLSEFYKRAIAAGIDHDPRGKDTVLKELERKKKSYDELKQDEKERFDTESLQNPYADSRILHGSGTHEVKTILAGIDVDTGELLLAETLRAKGTPIDTVLSHHPAGRALANLYAVMYMQADILSKFGVPINIAEDLAEGRMKDIERRLMPLNHTRAVDAARLLDMPYLCLHTPADNMVASYLQKSFDEQKPYSLDDIMTILRGIPEYKDAEKHFAGPKILIGSKTRKAGKIYVDMTGGTEFSKDIFQSLSLSGVNTVVGMHFSDDHRKEAEKYHMNVVIAGHISSDDLGLNLLLDQVIKNEAITIVECSGFRRISRSFSG